MNKIIARLVPGVVADNDILKRNYVISIALCLIIAALTTGVTVYNYATFLSFYPTKYIPYWLITESLTVLAVGNIISLYNPKSIKKFLCFMSSSIAITFFIVALTQSNWYWYPLIKVLLIKLISTYLYSLLLSYIAVLFYRNQLKSVFALFNTTISIGTILSSLIWACLTKYLELNYILYIIIAVLISILLITTPSTEIIKYKPAKGSDQQPAIDSPLKYPLLRQLFIISLVIVFIYGFANFLYLQQLGLNLNKQEIASYTSYVLLASGLTSMIFSMSVPIFFKKFNLKITLTAILIAIAISFIIYSIFNTLWAAILISVICSTFNKSFLSHLNAFLSSLFPPLIILKNNLYQKIYVSGLGKVFSAGIAILLVNLANMNLIISSTCILLALIGIFITTKLYQQYLSTLKKFLSESYFSNTSPSKEEIQAIQSLIFSELKNKSYTPMHLGLITPKVFPEPPTQIYEILNSSNDEQTKLTVIRILEQYPLTKLDSEQLIAKCGSSSNLSNKCRDLTFKLLKDSYSENLLKKVRSSTQDSAFTSENTLIFLLKHGHTKDYTSALQLTIELANSQNSAQRKIAAGVIGTLNEGSLFDIKTKLLTDPNPEVRTKILNNLPAKDIYNLLPSIHNMFKNNITSIHTRLTIAEQLHIAERLMCLLDVEPEIYGLTSMNFVTAILSPKTETYIKKLLTTTNTYNRSILAQNLINRNKQIPITKNLHAEILTALNRELELIDLYLSQKSFPELQKLNAIFTNRLYYAKQRVIYFYACLKEDTTETLNFIKHLNPLNQSLDNLNKKDNALEYLLAEEKDLQLKKSLEDALTDVRYSSLEVPKNYLKTLSASDPWLGKLIQKFLAKGSDDMNLIQKTIVLQQTALFANLPDEVLFELSKACTPKDCAANETIISENDSGENLHIIVSGELNVYKNQHLLATLKPCQCFGEISLLADINITSSVVAKERSKLLLISKQDFLNITDEFPQMLKTMIKIVITRLNSQVKALEV